jgi:uncharacterized protein YecT (DUF1311 family)
MRAITLIVALAMASTAAVARAGAKCETLNGNQVQLNQCYGAEFKRPDTELNRLYREIVDRLRGDADGLQSLAAAQKAWVRYRDAECAFATNRSVGGSVYPMILAGCLATLTQERIGDFKRYLACQQGDLDCPAPPR